MKKLLLILAAIIGASSCCGPDTRKVMARFVPERFDDFVFENNLVAGRIYGEALESCGKGQITSPGIDVWVKKPGELVCNKRYVDDLQNGRSYHINWGDGKDCYKVGRSLGAGASAVVIDGKVILPETNFRSYEILEDRPDKVTFALHYPEWEHEGEKISLRKKITVVPDSYFCKVEDTYVFEGASGDSLFIAAGVNRHASQDIMEYEEFGSDRYALWEGASDQSVEVDSVSRIGIAVVVPDAEFSCLSDDKEHALVGKKVKSGDTFTYYFASCWNEGDIKSREQWTSLVSGFDLEK